MQTYFMIKCIVSIQKKSSHWLLNNQIFSHFAIVKLSVNNAENGKVDNLEADFQQAPLVQFF